LKTISKINPNLSGLGIDVDEAATGQAVQNMKKTARNFNFLFPLKIC